MSDTNKDIFITRQKFQDGVAYNLFISMSLSGNTLKDYIFTS